jgi:hypothetical protein
MNILEDKAKEYLWPNRRKLEAIVVIGSIGLLVAYQFFDASSFVSFGIEENILILSIFILFFLEGMATEVSEATSKLQNEVSVLADQSSTSELKQVLSEYIADRRPNEVKMIEYSASTVDTIIHDAIVEGAKVKLLLKHPNSTIPDNQPSKILSQVRTMHSDLGATEDIQIRFYKPPAGVRARKFDDDLINCGWYTYQMSDQRGTHLKGHINPTILVTSDEKDDYRQVNQMFERIFENLWTNSDTLEDLYEIENPTNDAVASFQSWVGSKRCHDWVKAVSVKRDEPQIRP